MKTDSFEYFVTRTDNPDYMPYINGGDDDFDADNDINGDILIMSKFYGEGIFNISKEVFRESTSPICISSSQ